MKNIIEYGLEQNANKKLVTDIESRDQDFQGM